MVNDMYIAKQFFRLCILSIKSLPQSHARYRVSDYMQPPEAIKDDLAL